MVGFCAGQRIEIAGRLEGFAGRVNGDGQRVL